jgi:arsenate reductase-like glutaredoxin family protein
MKTINIYGSPNSKACNTLIKLLILRRVNFKLFNIENDKEAYAEFLKITNGDIKPPVMTDESGNILTLIDNEQKKI